MKMANLNQSLGKLDNCINNSLKVLDDTNVYVSLLFILFLYNTCLFKNINSYVSSLYDYSVVRVVVLLLIIYVSRKSTCLAILLAMAYVISLYFNSLNENFESMNMDNYKSVDNTDMMDQEEDDMMKDDMMKDDMMKDDTVESFMSVPMVTKDSNI